ncbi:MAG: hypothetical protein PHW10_02945 [Candidatus Peribacteraceae bacterium]|nr:hypothetical protein [Candidatus Peribacteraceae bacterium]
MPSPETSEPIAGALNREQQAYYNHCARNFSGQVRDAFFQVLMESERDGIVGIDPHEALKEALHRAGSREGQEQIEDMEAGAADVRLDRTLGVVLHERPLFD